eukprot:612324-Pleurochrysis_carterae.AAC.1
MRPRVCVRTSTPTQGVHTRACRALAGALRRFLPMHHEVLPATMHLAQLRSSNSPNPGKPLAPATH